MFICSVKGNTLKFIGIVCLAALLMISLIVFIPKHSEKEDAVETASEVRYDKIKSNTDRVKFLEQFGWKVDKTPLSETVVRIPKSFDAIMNTYNDIQKKQGLDLEKFGGKEAVRYTYKVTNYPGYDGEVSANIIVLKNAVIAGDVCSSDVDGFIQDLSFPKEAETDTAAPESENTESAAAEQADMETESVPETPPAAEQ